LSGGEGGDRSNKVQKRGQNRASNEKTLMSGCKKCPLKEKKGEGNKKISEGVKEKRRGLHREWEEKQNRLSSDNKKKKRV